jgi:hypothetical protein
MSDVDTLIKRWPSMAELGRDLDLPYSTVAAWKQRGSIPVTYWRQLVSAARRRGLSDVTSDLLIELHDQTKSPAPSGFAEDPLQVGEDQWPTENAGHSTGQFSRWKPLRRTHFATSEEIVDHVRGLRDEWDRR